MPPIRNSAYNEELDTWRCKASLAFNLLTRIVALLLHPRWMQIVWPPLLRTWGPFLWVLSFIPIHGCSSCIKWEVCQWSVAFSVKEFNSLTDGTSVGSITILVCSDSLHKQWCEGWIANLNLRSLIPSLHSIKKSEPSGLKNGITSGFCMSWQDIWLSWKQESPFIVC